MNENINLLAYCGLYCDACSFKVAFDENDKNHVTQMPSKYDEYKNVPLQFCPGCRLDNQCGHCAIRECAKSKNFSHCGCCADFPCEKLKKFNADGMPHHGETIANLKEIVAMGETAWLAFQKTKWACACGAKLSWYLVRCGKCGSSLK